MTVAAAPQITSQAPGRAGVLPTLTPGTELLGQVRGSGYHRAPYLVRRSDGQMLQLSELTFLVAALADGSRNLTDLAAAVSVHGDRPIGAQGVQFLLDNKLMPLGLVTVDETPRTLAPTANPLLTLRARATLLGPRATNAIALLLRPLFLPVVVVAVAAGMGALDFWLFVEHGLGRALHNALVAPSVLLWVLGLTLLSALFHELGHATGCRYGGARPGAVGVGIYLIWPSFFTNVTDAYRLGRGGRLRTDLGGIYFNSVFILAVAGLYAATGQEALLLVILLGHLEMVQQLMPFVRFDGYFILSDIAGIPDLFARIGPVVAQTLRRGSPDPRVQGLRRSSRVIVTVWTLMTIPLLGLNLGYLALQLPAVNGALWGSIRLQGVDVGRAFWRGSFAAVVLGSVSIALLALAVAGTLYIVASTARRVSGFAHRATSGNLVARVLLVAVTAVWLCGLVSAWVGRHEFHNWHA